jgi:predicted phage terminase large subunit-like protein
MKRARAKIDAAERLIVETAELDHDRWPMKRIVESIPKDPGSAGLSQVNHLSKALAGMNFKFSPETGSKEDRAQPFASQVNGGNVWMVRGDWNAALIEELRNFPTGSFKDQVDALSRAYAEIVSWRKPRRRGLTKPKVGAHD